ncbi:MAG: Maf family nucleotide pyrophosphatase [Burkholderiaceae bacterium]|jgi:septum formation protein|nr:Maf family nucleotide pyrophosphatase [Burkholderiaceae bacterium]
MGAPLPPTTPGLILASGSLYRKQLLTRLKIPFDVFVPNVDETPLKGELPHETAVRLSCLKAAAVGEMHPDAIVIGSDQVAMLDNEPLGKPGSYERALQQLQKMQGRCVTFHTALCVRDGRQKKPDKAVQTVNVPTRVTFRKLSDQELSSYLLTEQPYDCAGSARNEALGIILLESIESTDPTALTGLPLISLVTMLRRCGVCFFAEK